MPKALLKLVVCSLTIMHASAVAQVVDPQNVLIRNVRLLDAGSETESAIVHVLIKDNKLDLVSKEVFPTPEGVIAIDAENGFLFGKLKINETPSFIILNEDPRENFNVLLDTEEHAVFAVHEGELRKNNLFEVIEGRESLAEAPPEEPNRGWLAYAPPPMTLPLSYQDGDKWNQWQSKYLMGSFWPPLFSIGNGG